MDLEQGSKKNSGSATQARRGNGKAQAKKVPRALVPQFVAPELATLDSEVPTGPNWLHEIKWDGWRCQIIMDSDGIRIHTRKGNDWTEQLPVIVEAARVLKGQNFCIDGELIGATDDYDFYRLPAAIRRGCVR